MKVGDAIDKPRSTQNLRQDREKKHEWGRAGKQYLRATRAIVPDRRFDQSPIGPHRPDKPAKIACFVVPGGGKSIDFQAPALRKFLPLITRRSTGEPNQANLTTGLGELRGEQQSILAYRSKIGGKPIGNVKQRLLSFDHYFGGNW
jgi:hypothetical protein